MAVILNLPTATVPSRPHKNASTHTEQPQTDQHPPLPLAVGRHITLAHQSCICTQSLAWWVALQNSRAGPSQSMDVADGSCRPNDRATSTRSVALTSMTRWLVSTAATTDALPSPLSSITLASPVSASRFCHATCEYVNLHS